MKGRVTYDQVNSAVRSINKAVTEKYKILQQPLRTLNNVSRKLYDRFKENETGDTKGSRELFFFFWVKYLLSVAILGLAYKFY